MTTATTPLLLLVLLAASTRTTLVAAFSASVDPSSVSSTQGGGSSAANSYRVFVSTPTSKFPKRTVGDCCQRTFLTLSSSTPVDEAMSMFLSLRVQGAPVVDAGEGNGHKPTLVGMVSQFDFLTKEAFEGALLPLEQGGTRENLERYVSAAKKICGTVVSDVMTTSNLITITPETTMQDAAELMKRHKFHQLPVVESKTSKVVVGLLSSEDVMRDLLHVIKYLPAGKDDIDEEDNMSP